MATFTLKQSTVNKVQAFICSRAMQASVILHAKKWIYLPINLSGV